MKTLFVIFAFAVTLSAKAQVVFVNPMIINMGSFVQVQIQNTNRVDITCSGQVSMHTALGNTANGFYMDTIRAGALSVRPVYPMGINAPINFVTHTIFCHQAN